MSQQLQHQRVADPTRTLLLTDEFYNELLRLFNEAKHQILVELKSIPQPRPQEVTSITRLTLKEFLDKAQDLVPKFVEQLVKRGARFAAEQLNRLPDVKVEGHPTLADKKLVQKEVKRFNRLLEAMCRDIWQSYTRQEQLTLDAFTKGNNALAKIARTETIKTFNDAALARYKAYGTDKWQFLGTLDQKLCPVCEPLHLKIFDIGDTDNQPPRHPRCRCTVLPIVETVITQPPAISTPTREDQVNQEIGRLISPEDDKWVTREHQQILAKFSPKDLHRLEQVKIHPGSHFTNPKTGHDVNGYYDSQYNTIHTASDRETAQDTLAHEMGHFLDFQAGGIAHGKVTWASDGPEFKEAANTMTILNEGENFKVAWGIANHQNPEGADYFLSNHYELFAEMVNVIKKPDVRASFEQGIKDSVGTVKFYNLVKQVIGE